MVRTWLQGIGLDHAWPHFQAAGIVTADALAELESPHFAALSVQKPGDRRKLFFLVQRVKLELQQQQQEQGNRHLPHDDPSRKITGLIRSSLRKPIHNDSSSSSTQFYDATPHHHSPVTRKTQSEHFEQ